MNTTGHYKALSVGEKLERGGRLRSGEWEMKEEPERTKKWTSYFSYLLDQVLKLPELCPCEGLILKPEGY